MSERENYDPANDPYACSICGCALGMSKRVQGEEHCDGCLWEYGAMVDD